MTALQLAAPLVMFYEGLRLTAYLCPAGKWTIGYGHTGPDVKPGMKITALRAVDLLRADLQAAQRVVRKYTRVLLAPHQEAALISFVFNLGWARFSGSTLLRLLNQGRYEVVPAQLRRWNKATVNGVFGPLEGLTVRRTAEGKLWSTPQ